MNLVRGIVAVVRFQLGRSFTAARLLWWFVLVLFPPLVVGLTFLDVHGSEERKKILEQVQLQEVFVLVPNVACMLGVFLWTSTVLQSEIENRSWVYLAVRPRARVAHIVGSYLVAVIWTITSALMALMICMFEIRIPQEAQSSFVTSQVLLILVSATSYASIYLLIGVLFYRRAMIVAVIYTLGIEFMLGALPTTIAQLTLQFRMRTIWFIRMGWTDGKPPGMEVPMQLFGKPPVSNHVLCMILVSVVCVSLAGLLVSRREIPIQEESAFQ